MWLRVHIVRRGSLRSGLRKGAAHRAGRLRGPALPPFWEREGLQCV
jgi:hypothetical protein